jgi:hypothetical protein
MSKKPLVPPLDRGGSHHLSIQAQIEAIAEQAGVSAENRQNLETMLRALPQRERRRVRLFLQGVKAQSDNQAVQQAAEGFLAVAAKVWGR